jgi:hypothetical protein|eukprot:COSAG02_NODE_3387_length_6833_cov_54.669884_6_plen_175_part_00
MGEDRGSTSAEEAMKDSESAEEAYEDDTEPLDELLDDEPALGSQGKRGKPAPVDVDRRSGDGEPEEPLPSVARDTPSKRQARTLAADLEGVLGRGAESRAEQDVESRETWPSVPAPRRKSEEQIFAAIRAAQPYDAIAHSTQPADLSPHFLASVRTLLRLSPSVATGRGTTKST